MLQRYDLKSDSLLPPLAVGTSLTGADITASGNALYVQEGIRNAVEVMTRKVDLTTGQVTKFTYKRASLEGGGWDIGIAANGLADP